MSPAYCVFCKIVGGELPSMQVYEDDETLAFMDINPVTEGHCLVIPKVHRANLFELSEPEGAALMRATQRVAAAVRNILKPDGLNLLQANGALAFQTVFHFHFHVIPRYQGDPIKMPWIPRHGDPEKIRAAGERIRAGLGTEA